MDLVPVAKRALRVLDRHSPLLLTGLGVAGVVSTAVLAIKATHNSRVEIEDIQTTGGQGLTQMQENLLIVKTVWRAYIPAAGVGVLTIVAIIGAQSINSRRQAALVSGITIAERALTEYQDKSIELLGEKSDQKVRDAIAQDKVNENPLVLEGKPDTLDGKLWCYDTYSGQYFRSNRQLIDDAKNQINAIMINGEDTASLNEFYLLIGMHATRMGEDMGFNTQNLVDVNYSAVLTEGGEPCLAIGFRALPKQDYHHLSR